MSYFYVILFGLFMFTVNLLYFCKKCKKKYNEKEISFIEKETDVNEDNEIIEEEEEPPPYVEVVV